MARPPKPPAAPRPVETLTHADMRRNIPTAEYQSIAQQIEEREPVRPVHYPRSSPLPHGETRPRDPDLDPQIVWRGMRIRLTKAQVAQLQETGEVELSDAQLVWRGKDRQDWSDLVVKPPPIYIQEKVHPKAIIDGLKKQSRERAQATTDAPDLFADFNGLPDPEARLEFYQHDQHWSNRMILGDSLQVMASLAEREGLRGKVQCIYIDPPYGIKFNSNWQVNTQNPDVKDGKREDVVREPEQVRAFRDTWKNGIHSYLTYLRDRLTIARELLTDSGSIFVQIGDENVHRVRAVMDEVFGEANFVNQIPFVTTGGQSSLGLARVFDFVVWYAKSKGILKYRQLYDLRELRSGGGWAHSRAKMSDGLKVNLGKDEVKKRVEAGEKLDPYYQDNLASQGATKDVDDLFEFEGKKYRPPSNSHWKTHLKGMGRLAKAARIDASENSIRYVRLFSDSRIEPLVNIWSDTVRAGYIDQKRYVVWTMPKVIERCVLMATDPGDLVLDPTCGSGTTAVVSEQMGRRWITIDTSRVALTLARTRVMATKFPLYLLSDSQAGRAKEEALTGKLQLKSPVGGDIRQGFVYERSAYVTLKSIANNSEIDEIWTDARENLDRLRSCLNSELGTAWEDWEIPRNTGVAWSPEAVKACQAWWTGHFERQRRIDASIARRADVKFLYDRPFEDKSRVRVAGPFTVESLSPHRLVPADEDQLLDLPSAPTMRRQAKTLPVDFATMVLDNLRTAGVHQINKSDSIRFTSLQPWPGTYIGAEGHFMEGEIERRAGILIGPEFGTLSRADLVVAAREASETRFDVLIACAFNFDAHASELIRLGPINILKARMNPDLHMADDLKNTGKGNLFVVFGEPDLVVEQVSGQPDHVQIRILGVDVFDPQTGRIRSGETGKIAVWFIDTDYNEESFFVRHAYFLGDDEPYKALKAALSAEIDEEAWATLYRDVSRPFRRPQSGRIAVKVINHFGDEVMKVFTV